MKATANLGRWARLPALKSPPVSLNDRVDSCAVPFARAGKEGDPFNGRLVFRVLSFSPA